MFSHHLCWAQDSVFFKDCIVQEFNLPWFQGVESWRIHCFSVISSNFCLDSLFQTGILFAITTFLGSPYSSLNASPTVLRNLPLSCLSCQWNPCTLCCRHLLLTNWAYKSLNSSSDLSLGLLRCSACLPFSVGVKPNISRPSGCNRISCIIKGIFTESWPKLVNLGFG